MALLNIEALKAATSALKKEGILQELERREDQSLKDYTKDLLDNKELSIPHVIENISGLARNAEKEELRYKANELALKLHGVLSADEKAASQNISIQIIGEN